jgi:hypothetical protein
MSATKIWNGTEWIDLVGPQGPAGPTVVSADAGNVAKLGADGRISVQPSDMDSRWVNTSGDTMTGTLNITGAESVVTGFTVTSSGASALANVSRYDNGNAGAQFQLLKGRGTAAAPLPVVSGDIIGTLTYQTRSSGGTVAAAGFQRVTATAAPLAANTPSKMDFGVSNGVASPIVLSIDPTGVDITGVASINQANPETEAAAAKLVVVGSNQSASNLAQTNTLAAVSIRPNSSSGYTLAIGAAVAANNPYLQGVNFNGGAAAAPLSIQPYGGNLAIGKSGTPTSVLDVVGTVAISGNITSTGTAHNFAANSITASAIAGLPTASTVAGLADTVSGTVGTSTAYSRADHTHPSPPAVLVTASRGIAPSDMGRLLVNAYTGTNTLTPIKFTLPAAGDQAIPVGSWFDLCDASANSPTAIASPDGVNLLWNASLTGGSATTFAGGTLSTLTINGMFSRLKVLKTAPLIWIVLG